MSPCRKLRSGTAATASTLCMLGGPSWHALLLHTLHKPTVGRQRQVARDSPCDRLRPDPSPSDVLRSHGDVCLALGTIEQAALMNCAFEPTCLQAKAAGRQGIVPGVLATVLSFRGLEQRCKACYMRDSLDFDVVNRSLHPFELLHSCLRCSILILAPTHLPSQVHKLSWLAVVSWRGLSVRLMFHTEHW